MHHIFIHTITRIQVTVGNDSLSFRCAISAVFVAQSSEEHNTLSQLLWVRDPPHKTRGSQFSSCSSRIHGVSYTSPHLMILFNFQLSILSQRWTQYTKLVYGPEVIPITRGSQFSFCSLHISVGFRIPPLS